jgi:hypothetical protein
VWVCQENVYVTALTMIDLQHHRRTTAEGPVIDDKLVCIGLSYMGAGYSE